MRRPAAAALTACLVLTLSVAFLGPMASAEPIGSGERAPELVQAEALLADAPAETVDGETDHGPRLEGAAEAAATDREATMALRDLWLARPTMTRPERHAADALLARPTVPGEDVYASYGPDVPTARTCNDRICVTYATSSGDRSTEAWADQTLDTVDGAWSKLVGEMGFPAPAGDGSAGGDARFDVYLANISAKGFYGYCVPEAKVAGQPNRAQSYCVLDNDMTGFSMGPTASLAVTAAHEFFHAIQFNIDAREDQWFMEASATWVEDQVADTINDNRQFLKAGQLGSPALPLDTYSSDLAMYGNWIFVQKIAQSMGVDSIRQIWERLDGSVGAPDEYSIQGIRNYLSSRNVRWGKFYARFVEANLLPRRKYEEGRVYKASPIAERHVLRARATNKRIKVKVSHLASHTVQFRAARSVTPRARLKVKVRARDSRGATPVARLLVFKKNGGISRVDVPVRRNGVGTRKVSLHRSKVRRVVLVLANASTRSRECGEGSIWACGGRPVDDGQRFKVVARLIG